NYQSELTINYLHQLPGIDIEINGRIDGLFTDEEITTLEEIKTISDFKTGDPKFEIIFFPCFSEYKEAIPTLRGKSAIHWAQALMYAYIWCKNNNLPYLRIKLTYYHNETNKEYPFLADFSITWLETFFNYTLQQWLNWAKSLSKRIAIRNARIQTLDFPFEFRKEQRKMAVAVYNAINNGQMLYVRAPTGTGKTMASLYPAIKAMGEKKIDKLFFLTAKTVGRTVAVNALRILNEKEANLKYLVLTAKEKTCLMEFPLCEPTFCPYADNFFGKLKVALTDIMQYNEWDSTLIQEIAEKHIICPFELALTLSEYADVVICDYNYVFDPIVMIKRLFDEVREKYCFLIDEAHNMPDRAREMYSGNLTLEILNSPMPFFKENNSAVAKEAIALRDNFIQLANSFQQNEILLKDFPHIIKKSIIMIINHLPDIIFKLSPSKIKYILICYYYELYFYIDTFSWYGDNYKTVILKSAQETNLKLYCLNATEYIKGCLQNAIATAIFSATLIPYDYYEYMISYQSPKNKYIALSSPFAKEKCEVIAYTALTSEYKSRSEDTYQDIADLIISVCAQKQGNYLIYYPSFAFMEQVMRKIDIKGKNMRIINQERLMSEEARKDFLSNFKADNPYALIGMAVLGGIFAEGIDLEGDKLIGSIIIGVGLSAMDLQKDLLKSYFRKQNKNGFNYAYRYPAFNKVLQAGGRVIRTENDRGIIILVDYRYTVRAYKELFPVEWQHVYSCSNIKKIERYVKEFWEFEKI
ncbi:MAG TPA: ATP-dependent DNA helicase, partial [Candidatus Cloacimonadota bacterium]|nr:ATP-dependent DNA helicase [Candidatus Cloacimonadota bacterium]